MIHAISMSKYKIMNKPYFQSGIRNYFKNSIDSIKAVDLNIPIESAQYVVVDTELTGLQPKKDSIVSIGAVKMFGGKIFLGNNFYKIVEPRTKLTAKSVVIHGITPSEVAECPGIAALLPEFLDFCGNSVIVGHFVTIDISFINVEMKRLYGFHLQNPFVDTLRLYTWMRQKEEDVCAYHGGLSENTNLFSLAQKYNVPVSKSHNALDDAFVTAQLFQRFISFLPKFGIKNVGDLLRIGRQ